MGKEKVIVFGVGNGYNLNKRMIFDNFTVLALADNATNIHNTELDGYKIISADIIRDFDYDLILVTASNRFSLEIKKQLLNMGIPISKIRFVGNGGIAPYRIDPLFFASDLCYEEKKGLFSQNIERVVLELNSKCNRKCWFCTNSLFGGEEKNVDMSDELFEKILCELRQINYNQTICLSYFNEPLISKKFIERVSVLKKSLPDTMLYAFTNGDYLTREVLDSLNDAGLDTLYIDIYINTMKYDCEKAYDMATRLFDKLGISLEIHRIEKGLYAQGMYKNLEIQLRSQDFFLTASNRAESLCNRNLPIPEIKSHPLPCIKNFISFHIDYRGDVWPCPNYHREYEPHRQYCVGNVLDETIYDIYMGEKMTDYRKRNFFERSTLPCRSCIWNFNTFITNSFLLPFRDRPSVESHDNCSWCTIKERNKS